VLRGGLVAALVFLAPSGARAAEIRWSGAPECRREVAVVEQVESMTERRLPEVDVADFELVLEAAGEGAFALTLVTSPRDARTQNRRSFAGASCADVTDAAAVAIALTIGDPPSTDSTVAPRPAPEPVVDSSASSVTARRDRYEPRSVSRPSWRLGASVVVDTAVTPRAVVGGAGRLVFGFGRFRAELEGAAFAPSESVDARGRGGRFQLMYAAPFACLASPFGAVSVDWCAGYELGRVTAEGVGVGVPRERAGLWQGLRADVGLVVPVTPSISLAGRLGAALGLARPRFVLDEPTAVHQPAVVSLRTSLGVELAL
jgi:hypothetical protein